MKLDFKMAAEYIFVQNIGQLYFTPFVTDASY